MIERLSNLPMRRGGGPLVMFVGANEPIKPKAGCGLVAPSFES